LLHQVPGGMLSNLLSQLHEQDALDRLPEVLAEVPRVRADLGYPPLVTPTSQIVGVQAVVNVLTGGRYVQVTQEVRDYVLGLYGTAPGPIDPALRAKVSSAGTATDGRPADRLAPEFDRALTEVRTLLPHAEAADALSYAMFPAVYRSYRAAVDAGLTSDVLAAAALGVVTMLRTPAPPPVPTSSVGPSAGGVGAWAHEGRARMQAQRRWVDASRRRTGW
jgi:pyruvate/oxaloacetate carboxyltransferase